MPSSTPPERRSPAALNARYAGLGMQFAATFLLFGLAGYWLDGRFGTGPWLMIAGIALGAGGSFWSLLRKVPPPRGTHHPPE